MRAFSQKRMVNPLGIKYHVPKEAPPWEVRFEILSFFVVQSLLPSFSIHVRTIFIAQNHPFPLPTYPLSLSHPNRTTRSNNEQDVYDSPLPLLVDVGCARGIRVNRVTFDPGGEQGDSV